MGKGSVEDRIFACHLMHGEGMSGRKATILQYPVLCTGTNVLVYTYLTYPHIYILLRYHCMQYSMQDLVHIQMGLSLVATAAAIIGFQTANPGCTCQRPTKVGWIVLKVQTCIMPQTSRIIGRKGGARGYEADLTLALWVWVYVVLIYLSQWTCL